MGFGSLVLYGFLNYYGSLKASGFLIFSGSLLSFGFLAVIGFSLFLIYKVPRAIVVMMFAIL